MKETIILKAINEASKLIYSEDFSNNNKLKSEFFTRNRKMNFPMIILCILNFMKKTLQVELNNFNKLILKLDVSISKVAFSKARRKISPNAFIELFNLTSKLWLEENEYKTYQNHRIFAIDGSIIQLENTKELLDEFGYLGSNKTACRARASILCDVLNGVVVHSELKSIQVDERTMALNHINYFDEYAKENDIIIFDRGYPSKKLIAMFDSKKWKYLMRVSKGFNPQIDNSTEQEFYITICYDNKDYKVRVLKLKLPTGETEILLTNIDEKDFKYEDFIVLYYKRWPVETKYDTVKNKLLLETFSGKTTISVLQDFYATMYLANMVAFAKIESDEMIENEQKDKDLKYEYQTNEKVLIGSLKNELILAIICKNPETRVNILQQVINEASRSRSEIRPNRHFERSESNKWKKARCAKKKNAI